VRVTCVADCCHSGSVMDLAFEWRWRGETFIETAPQRRRSRPAILARDFTVVSKKHTAAEVILFSGCKDEQTSADVSNVRVFSHEYAGPGKSGGACTNALAEVLAGGEEAAASVSWGKLLELMQGNLKRRNFSQVPQLSSSVKIDMTRAVSLFGDVSASNR
jgi:hypothetical protein